MLASLSVQRATLELPRSQPADRPQQFRFAAIAANGQVIRSTLRSHSRKSAQEQLLLRYAHLLSLEEVAERRASVELALQGRRARQSLPAYTRSIAVMFEAGLSLTTIFETAARGENPYLNRVMLDVSESLKRGRSLSNSLSRWSNIFDGTFVGMVYSAEQSGRLHKTFGQLADLLEKRWRIEKRIKSVMAYPALVGVVGIAIFWILVAFVMPALVPSFTSIGAELPWLTRMLLALGNLSTSLPSVLGLVLLSAGLAGLAYRVVIQEERCPRLAYLLDQLKFGCPIFGDLFRLSALSRTLSTVAAMLAAGLPLSKVLEIGARVSGSRYYEQQFATILTSLREGGTMADAMEGNPAFPPLVVGATRLGEETGKTPLLMAKIAALYEEDLDLRVSSLASLIEPVIMAVVGLVVGVIVLGTFAPMIQLVQAL